MLMLQATTTFGTIGDPTPLLTADIGLLLVKLLFLAAGLLYVIFAVIVTRQVHVMKNTLITPFSPFVLILGYVHLLIAFTVFAFFLML